MLLHSRMTFCPLELLFLSYWHPSHNHKISDSWCCFIVAWPSIRSSYHFFHTGINHIGKTYQTVDVGIRFNKHLFFQRQTETHRHTHVHKGAHTNAHAHTRAQRGRQNLWGMKPRKDQAEFNERWRWVEGLSKWVDSSTVDWFSDRWLV